ncbi:MAG: hypothetical protein HY687_03990 [Chloroflexi bacterium]|nr:hypothetical protein [Chloroflexota bacterium]
MNERSKRLDEEYKRKEQRYSELIASLQGFTVALMKADSQTSKQMRANFLHQLNLCWMYCPDEVIRKAYHFLATVREGTTYKEDERGKAAGEFLLSIRSDLIGRKPLRKTELKPDDFELLAPKE